MATNYTTKTAALRATKADINKLDAKKVLLNGKNILDYISDSEFNSYDTRDPQLKNDELDIWNTEISLSEEGHIEVKPHVHYIKCNEDTNWENVHEGITESQYTILVTAVKVIDNEVLGANDEHIMYWQSNGLTSGYMMFNGCGNLTTFSSDLSSLTEGVCMFEYSNLESFTSDLSSLTYSELMFSYNRNLESFTSDLSSLTDGYGMFSNCSQLTSFTSDSSGSPVNLSSLISSTGMFFNCTNLTSFSSDLSSLTEGGSMFCDCSNLKSFSSDLSSLTNGLNMFTGCKLDAQSVANIIHTLPYSETSSTITIGCGCEPTNEDMLAFIQECDCETAGEFIDEFESKNWHVEIQYNGRPTTTYNMRRGESLPIHAKLEEVIMPTNEKERKPHYAYTSADGSKFYNINYFHSTNGSTEGYDVFSSLEEAISTYNVTPKN